MAADAVYNGTVETAEASGAMLDYAPRPPVYRRRIVIRALWLMALLTLSVLAWRFGVPYAKQVRYLYWQSRCLAFEAPADHLAYEEDPARAAALLMAQPGYQAANPICRQVAAGVQPPVGFVPPPMAQLTKSWVCMAFVGERTSAGGQRRLAVLGYQVHLNLSTGTRTFELY